MKLLTLQYLGEDRRAAAESEDTRVEKTISLLQESYLSTPSRPSPKMAVPLWALRILPAHYKTTQPTQPSHLKHTLSDRATSGFGEWSLGTTSERIVTTQTSRRVINGATICRKREDEPRTPLTTLGHGSMCMSCDWCTYRNSCWRRVSSLSCGSSAFR